MERVAQGGTVVLTAQYQTGVGDLTDPATPRVDIIDADGTELVTNATPTRMSLGNYSFAYAVPGGGDIGIWRIHWSGTVEGFAAGGDDWFNVVAPGDLIVPRSTFATIDELAAYLGEELTGLRLAQATLALESATGIIKSWTRQNIERVAFDTISLTGPAGWALELPERPVESVTTVTVDGVALDASLWRLEDSTLVRAGGWWWSNSGTVEVTYSHGYDPIPADVRAVTLQLAARGLGGGAAGISQEAIGTYSVTYAGGGVADADPLLATLSRYRIRATSVPMRNDSSARYHPYPVA